MEPRASVTHGQDQVCALAFVIIRARLHLSVADCEGRVCDGVSSVCDSFTHDFAMRASREIWASFRCSVEAGRMLPKWLQAMMGKAFCTGVGSIIRCDVLHSPEYWVIRRTSQLGHFVLQCTL